MVVVVVRHQQSLVGAQRGSQPIRRVEDHRSAAPIGLQREAVGRPAVDLTEVVAELQDVAGGRTPPAVDRLERVADRRDRVPAAEECPQQSGLRGGGVLVLVEQHHREPLTQLSCYLGRLLGQRGRLGHLVGELDQAPLVLQPSVVVHQAQQLGSGADRGLCLAHSLGRLTAIGLHTRQLLGEVVVVRQHRSLAD